MAAGIRSHLATKVLLISSKSNGGRRLQTHSVRSLLPRGMSDGGRVKGLVHSQVLQRRQNWYVRSKENVWFPARWQPEISFTVRHLIANRESGFPSMSKY